MTDSYRRSDAELDFTIAHGIRDDQLITALRNFFADLPEDRTQVDRSRLNAALDHEYRLTKSDAESLFTGLVLNDVATQTANKGSFADYTFDVMCAAAAEVLEGQRIARTALDEVGVSDVGSNDTQTELTATFPSDIDGGRMSAVRPLSDDLRQLFFGADSIVRIANPYFDPKPAVVGDIASLANRGVTTKVLTRETFSADSNLKDALNAIYEETDAANRHRLNIRDLYERNDMTGRQSYATHAKIAIADQEVCYIGSANLTDTSLSNNFELGVIIRGEKVDVAIDIFETVFDYSKKVELPL